MLNALKLWWKNLFKHIDDGYTNTEGESHNYTSLMDESVKLGEESYSYIDKQPPHLVLETPPQISYPPELTLPPPPLMSPITPSIPDRLPISMKQRFQQEQYNAFLDDKSIDPPSTNTRSQKRRKLKPIFKDCFTQTPTKTDKNIENPTISYKNVITPPQNKPFNNSKEGGRQNRN
tara:strand:+ start:1105 stop:1632 length:528 start_codon:yes stop_codon:yes gene_type:complete